MTGNHAVLKDALYRGRKVALLVFFLGVTACLYSPEVATARKFIGAFIRRDVAELQEVTAPEKRDAILATVVAYFGLGLIFDQSTSGSLKISTSDMKYLTVKRFSNGAIVQVQGKLTIAMANQRMALPLQLNIITEQRNNRWLVTEVSKTIP